MHLPCWIVDIFSMADINQSCAIIHGVKLCRRSQSTSKHGRGWRCPRQRCHRFIGYDWHFYLKKKTNQVVGFKTKIKLKLWQVSSFYWSYRLACMCIMSQPNLDEVSSKYRLSYSFRLLAPADFQWQRSTIFWTFVSESQNMHWSYKMAWSSQIDKVLEFSL